MNSSRIVGAVDRAVKWVIGLQKSIISNQCEVRGVASVTCLFVVTQTRIRYIAPASSCEVVRRA